MAKKLYRAPEDKSMIGGVCAGIADYFDIDPTLVRLAFLFIVLARGAGILAYIIAWVIIPEKSSFDNEADIYRDNDNSEKKSKERRKMFGIILVALGLGFLVDIWIPHFYWGKLWPFLVIGLGLVIIIKDKSS